ncbi:RNA polymerase sigma factor [Gammaproteobacteria bacterium]|nr:RNA polymerase sigma factor [Gammaproteobacteria bacterium]
MDKEELSLLFSGHYSTVTAYAYTLEKDWTRALDLTQTAFLKAAKNIERYEKGSNFRAWIKTITLNTYKDRLKSKAVTSTEYLEDTQDWENSIGTSHDVTDGLLIQQVNKRIESWREPDSVIMKMAIEGFSYDEIAEAIELTRTNVGAILCRRRQELAKAFMYV